MECRLISIAYLTLFRLLLVAILLAGSGTCLAQRRVAVLPIEGGATVELRKMAERSGFELTDEAQLESALTGARYKGDLNLSTEEARGLGLSIGCDFFVTGIARVQRRLLSEKESYFDVIAALFAVETRTGQLAGFAFSSNRFATEKDASQALPGMMATIWPKAANAIESAIGKEEIANKSTVYDLDSKEAERLGIKPPQFFRRIKPQMTESADLAGISATIELKVEFLADGKIGLILPLKWGGFGLDEAAESAVRQLRFEPATLNGKPVSVSAMVRYNFRKEEKSK